MTFNPYARATRALIALLLLAQQPLTMTLATPSVSSGVQFPSAVEWISPSAGVLTEALEVSSGNATFALEGLGESNQRSVLTDSSGGSAIKYYQAVADEFIVPISLLEGFTATKILQNTMRRDYERFSRSVSAAGLKHTFNWHIRLYRDD